MDVITMQSINSLIKRLKQDHPGFVFKPADEFWWSAATQTVYYDPSVRDCHAFCLHELSHALLGHQGYSYDINLIKLERNAWDYAKNALAPLYGVPIPDDIIQDNLDTYRAWLHARSICPQCETTGVQMNSQHYRCLGCGHTWRANEARQRALRRYSVTSK